MPSIAKPKMIVFDAFFAAVNAPPWHGRNLDTLNDSICEGQINGVEVPYRIVVKKIGSATDEARQMLDDFSRLIHCIAGEGCHVSFTVESSDQQRI